MLSPQTSKKRNKLSFAVITLLVVTIIAPQCITYANAGGSSSPCNCPDIPGGIPSNTVQCNKTDTTPVCEMEQTCAGEPYLFLYRNMTMLMNCTQNCTLVVTIDPKITPKILGLSIDTNQTIMLTIDVCQSPLQDETAIEQTLNFYLGIEPNCTLLLSAQMRLHINQTTLNQEMNREVNASRLTWMCRNQTSREWVPVDSYMDQNGFLVCNTNHFSMWTVAEIPQAENSTPTSGNWLIYGIVGAMIAAIAITLVFIIIHRR